MNKIVRKIVVILAAVMICMMTAAESVAQTLLPEEEVSQRTEQITSGYEAWQSVDLKGKIVITGFPVKPSVRIFMLNSARIMISVAAPFIGEAARIEMTRDSLLVVDKLHGIYGRESMAELFPSSSSVISIIQNIILGRVGCLRSGGLSHETMNDYDFFEAEEGGCYIVPKEIKGSSVDYGYAIDAEGALKSVVGALTDKSVSAQIDYASNAGGISRQILFKLDERQMYVGLELRMPSWNAVPFETFTPDGRFREVNIKDLIFRLFGGR